MCGEIMHTRSRPLPVWDRLSYAAIKTLYLSDIHRRGYVYLLHRSLIDSILVPLNLPARVPVPHIRNDCIRIFLYSSRRNQLRNMLLAESYRFIIPAQAVTCLGKHLISPRRAVYAMLCIPPCSAYCSYVVAEHIFRNHTVMINMVVPGEEFHLPATQEIQKHIFITYCSTFMT